MALEDKKEWFLEYENSLYKEENIKEAIAELCKKLENKDYSWVIGCHLEQIFGKSLMPKNEEDVEDV